MNLSSFRRHSPGRFASSVSPVSYQEGATCPDFLDFMDFFTCGDREIATTIQQWFASVWFADLRSERLIWFSGKGANGKSVLIAVLSHLIGEQNVGGLSIKQLSGKHDLASLADKKLNICMKFE